MLNASLAWTRPFSFWFQGPSNCWPSAAGGAGRTCGLGTICKKNNYIHLLLITNNRNTLKVSNTIEPLFLRKSFTKKATS